MVNVVNDSINGYAYRETNLELARENGELRQQLSQVVTDIANQREEVHKKEVKIVELTSQLRELTAIKEKYDSIVKIVLDITHDVTEPRAIEPPSIYPTNRLEYLANADDGSLVDNRLEPISEGSHEIPSPDCRSSIDDSLEPREVTSMMPYKAVETIINTTSIFNVLDGVEIDDQQHERTDERQEHDHQREEPTQNITQVPSSCVTMSNNPTSPIQPIGNKAANKINSVFHSTPVQVRSIDRLGGKNQSPGNQNPNLQRPAITRIESTLSSSCSRKIKENQENVVLVNDEGNKSHLEVETEVVKPVDVKKTQGRKRKAPKNDQERQARTKKPPKLTRDEPQTKFHEPAEEEKKADSKKEEPPMSRYNLRKRPKV